ncbi:MAG: M48 family metallopeptidase [Candidatus Omnitrophica bacterium]|nr:M48 family metallopeptidase [Candidatus Omnitrophota bacterium]
MSPDEAAGSAQTYARAKRRAMLWDLVFTCSFLSGILLTPAASTLAGFVTSRFAGWPLQTALYVTALAALFTCFEFPMVYHRSFGLEHRFGLSNLTFGRWLWDYAKQIALGGALGLLVVEALAGLMRFASGAWWLWALAASLAWSALLTWVMPVLLLPIFYRQYPLREGELRQRLTRFLSRRGLRVSGIFEINLSRTTKKANACLCGLGSSRRVLVSDTLVATHTPDEVEVVLAHELGHHRKRHLGVGLAVTAAASGLGFYLADLAIRSWGPSLGIGGLTDLAALPLLAWVLFLAGTGLLPATNGLSRFLEAQADRYALEATGNAPSFISTMRRLGRQNLAELSPPAWVEWLLYDHPSIARRIAMAEGFRNG